MRVRLPTVAGLARRSTAASVSVSLCARQDVVARKDNSDLEAALSVAEYWLQVLCGIRFFRKTT